jgi:hypothetical protein
MGHVNINIRKGGSLKLPLLRSNRDCKKIGGTRRRYEDVSSYWMASKKREDSVN